MVLLRTALTGSSSTSGTSSTSCRMGAASPRASVGLYFAYRGSCGTVDVLDHIRLEPSLKRVALRNGIVLPRHSVRLRPKPVDVQVQAHAEILCVAGEQLAQHVKSLRR